MDAFRASDRTVGAIVGVGTLLYLIAAWRIPAFSLGTVPIQSRAFPLGLGALLLVLSGVLVARPGDHVEEDGDEPAAGDRPIRHRTSDPRREVFVLLAGAAVYVAAFLPLGFVLATVLYIIATAWWFAYERPVVTAVVAVALAAGTQVAFAQLLGVRLPSGVLAPLGL